MPYDVIFPVGQELVGSDRRRQHYMARTGQEQALVVASCNTKVWHSHLHQSNRSNSGLEPVTTKAARELGEWDEKSQRYVFADREKHAAYVAARRAMPEQDVTIDAPVIQEAGLALPLSAAERVVIDPVVAG
jgi:hypothetical protein